MFHLFSPSSIIIVITFEENPTQVLAHLAFLMLKDIKYVSSFEIRIVSKKPFFSWQGTMYLAKIVPVQAVEAFSQNQKIEAHRGQQTWFRLVTFRYIHTPLKRLMKGVCLEMDVLKHVKTTGDRIVFAKRSSYLQPSQKFQVINFCLRKRRWTPFERSLVLLDNLSTSSISRDMWKPMLGMVSQGASPGKETNISPSPLKMIKNPAIFTLQSKGERLCQVPCCLDNEI